MPKEKACKAYKFARLYHRPYRVIGYRGYSPSCQPSRGEPIRLNWVRHCPSAVEDYVFWPSNKTDKKATGKKKSSEKKSPEEEFQEERLTTSPSRNTVNTESELDGSPLDEPISSDYVAPGNEWSRTTSPRAGTCNNLSH